jgi:hypothetical protein
LLKLPRTAGSPTSCFVVFQVVRATSGSESTEICGAMSDDDNDVDLAHTLHASLVHSYPPTRTRQSEIDFPQRFSVFFVPGGGELKSPPTTATWTRAARPSASMRYAPKTADFMASSFAHVDWTNRTLCGASVEACLGVAHATGLGGFCQ